MDGRTDGRTDGRMDGRKETLIWGGLGNLRFLQVNINYVQWALRFFSIS